MKENKTPIIATFTLLAGFAVGFYLNNDSNKVQLNKSEEKRQELIQLLDNQTEINTMNNITIEELQIELEQYFNNRNKALEYNNDLRR